MVVKETRKGVVHEHSQSVYEYGKVSEKEKGGEQANKLSTNTLCVCSKSVRAWGVQGREQSHNEVCGVHVKKGVDVVSRTDIPNDALKCRLDDVADGLVN